MSDKAKSIYFAVLGIAYFIFTSYFTSHGIHLTNTLITVSILVMAGYYYLKVGKQGK